MVTHLRMTSADVLAVNNSEELIGVIMQVAKRVPELGFYAASPIAKTVYETLVLTALPTVGFRAANAGRTVQKPTLTTATVTCKFLEDRKSVV